MSAFGTLEDDEEQETEKLSGSSLYCIPSQLLQTSGHLAARSKVQQFDRMAGQSSWGQSGWLAAENHAADLVIMIITLIASSASGGCAECMERAESLEKRVRTNRI